MTHDHTFLLAIYQDADPDELALALESLAHTIRTTKDLDFEYPDKDGDPWLIGKFVDGIVNPVPYLSVNTDDPDAGDIVMIEPRTFWLELPGRAMTRSVLLKPSAHGGQPLEIQVFPLGMEDADPIASLVEPMED